MSGISPERLVWGLSPERRRVPLTASAFSDEHIHIMSLRRVALSSLLVVAASLGGCATVAGTAVSPLTGGVDLCREALDSSQWYWAPFVWVGGTVGAPFVAFYNGIDLDARGLTLPNSAYWQAFPHVFRPWGLIL